MAFGKSVNFRFLQMKLPTLMRQTVTPFLVRVQNRDFPGLEERHKTGSGGIFGRAGTVESCLAADVGKYIQWRYTVGIMMIRHM